MLPRTCGLSAPPCIPPQRYSAVRRSHLTAVIAAILTRTPTVPEHAGPLRDLLSRVACEGPLSAARRGDCRTRTDRRLEPIADSWASPETAGSGLAVVPGSIGEQAVRAEAAQRTDQRPSAEERRPLLPPSAAVRRPPPRYRHPRRTGRAGAASGPPGEATQRARIFVAAGSIIVVAAIVLTFVLIKLNAKTTPPSGSAISNGHAGVAPTAVVSKVTSVPASTLNAVGSGAFTGKIQTITGNPAPLTANGKPELLYIGAEYCPYCAAERWAMIVAMSRFGTFSGLATVKSAVSNGAGDQEPFPDTPTWTFAHASYSSPYLTFSEVELYTNIPDTSTGGYTALQTATSAELALLSKYDAPPYVDSAADSGSIPFLDFGNTYLSIGASYNPQVLSGLSWNTIAADLSNPNSSVAKAVDGTANYITAAICSMTGNQPASACTTTVRSLETQLKS